MDNQDNTRKTYSTVLSQQQSPKFPSKQQAVLFSSIEGVKLQEYLLALGSVIGPKNITFSSRISNNRICIYLLSKEILDKFMEEYGAITVNNENLQARRLVTPSVRLLLSNVCPTIPHTILEKELRQMGLNIISPTTFLRIGATNPEYSHILSFRRQVYISPPENINIPESIIVSHEDTTYRIFLSQDGFSCFKCKQPGHIASQCQTEVVIHMEQDTAATTSKRSIDEILTPPIQDAPTNDETSTHETFLKPEVRKPKKPRANETGKVTTLQKTPTPETTKSTEELMRPAKPFIESQSPPFILNYDQITDFLENSLGSPDPLSIAKNYTDDIPALLEILTKIYPYFTHRSLKTRCTKIRKKIMKQLDTETPDYETDSSQETF